MEKIKRVLLKLSGEALAADAGRGLDFPFIHTVCAAVKDCVDQGVQVGVVVGGGNFWRGLKDGGDKMERSRADQMGMLATIINSLALQDVLEQHGQPAKVLTAQPMGNVAEPYSRPLADRYLSEGKVVIFGGGTGNPYFSTDTAAVLRACEIGADMILLAKNIDGVYSADPRKDAKQLQVMDLPATSLALENKIPAMVFPLADPANILRAIKGEAIGTKVTL